MTFNVTSLSKDSAQSFNKMEWFHKQKLSPDRPLTKALVFTFNMCTKYRRQNTLERITQLLFLMPVEASSYWQLFFIVHSWTCWVTASTTLFIHVIRRSSETCWQYVQVRRTIYYHDRILKILKIEIEIIFKTSYLISNSYLFSRQRNNLIIISCNKMMLFNFSACPLSVIIMAVI